MTFDLGECQLLFYIKRKGWTQAEFARQKKCTRQYVNDLISGDKVMSLPFAGEAAKLLDCDVTDLYPLLKRDND